MVFPRFEGVGEGVTPTHAAATVDSATPWVLFISTPELNNRNLTGIADPGVMRTKVGAGVEFSLASVGDSQVEVVIAPADEFAEGEAVALFISVFPLPLLAAFAKLIVWLRVAISSKAKNFLLIIYAPRHFYLKKYAITTLKST